MKKICIDCRYIGEKPSGIGEMIRALVEFVPGLAPDCEFLFLSSASSAGTLSSAMNVAEIAMKSPATGPGAMWWLPQQVDLRGVDLFHAPSNFLPAGLKMRTITTIHDIMWLTHPNWCNSRLYGQIERRFYAHGIRRALKRSNHITTVSGATRDAILGIEPTMSSKISPVLSGVSERFRPVPVDRCRLREIGLPEGRRFVLTVGQYAPYKNHEGAITAFARAFSDSEDVDLIMVQRRNRGFERLTKLAKDLGISDRVHLTGALPEDVLLQLYSGAAALLHPSFCEGFGNPVAEAMACGCPVIVSDRSAMPEVAGPAARLVDPNNTAQISDALLQIVYDSNLAAGMREASKARAAQLSWEGFARMHVDIYRQVLAGA